MKYLIIAAIGAMLASCAGLDGTVIEFGKGTVVVKPPTTPIVFEK